MEFQAKVPTLDVCAVSSLICNRDSKWKNFGGEKGKNVS